MKYLLDTDTLSNLTRRTPAPRLLARMTVYPPAERATSSVTVGEMLYGALRLGPEGQALLARIEQVLQAVPTIFPFDGPAARRYAAARAALERAGVPLDEADLRIGAIALANDLTVVTGNVRHFGRIPGLTVENWLL